MTLQEDALGRSYDAGLMRRMLTYLRPRRGLVALAVALLIVITVLTLTPSGLFGRVTVQRV